MKSDMVSGLESGAPGPMNGRASLACWLSVAILTWISIWICLFQYVHPDQLKFLFLPVLSLLGFFAVAFADRPFRLGPWAYWFGALLIYAALSNALNPSFFSSWRHVNDFLVSVAFGMPILFAMSQAAVSARVLCGTCIALCLLVFLDYILVYGPAGIDIKGNIISIESLGQLPERLLRKIPDGWIYSGRSVQDEPGVWPDEIFYFRSQRATTVWLLFLTWIALAALRLGSRRDWLVAAVVFVIAGLAIAIGYSWATMLAFVAGIGVFLAALWSPRLALGLLLAAFLVFSLGMPLWADGAWLWFMSVPEIFDGMEYERSIVIRLARWHYWSEIIERQPWTGLGLGAYKGFPNIPFMDVFGARDWYPALMKLFVYIFPGQYPHNFLMQVWSELGVFGILLAAGFVASLLVNTFPTRTWDAAASARVALLVSVLLIYSVDRSVWDTTDVIQLLITAGLAVGTMNLSDRSAPSVALPGLSLRRERYLVMAVLSIGVFVAAGNSTRVYLADSRYAPERTILDTAHGVLRHHGEEIALDGRAVGRIDRVTPRGDAVRVSGWSFDPAATGEAIQVLIFRGAGLLGVTRTGRASPARQRQSTLPNLDMMFTAFQLQVPRPSDEARQDAIHAVFLDSSGGASLVSYEGTQR